MAFLITYKVQEPASGFLAGCGWLGRVWHLNLVFCAFIAFEISQIHQGAPYLCFYVFMLLGFIIYVNQSDGILS
jgi:hypothetical protein